MENPTLVFTQISDFLEYLGPDFRALIANTPYLANTDLAPTFPFCCSRHYADLIKQAKNPAALLREVLPTKEEYLDVPGFTDDPVGDIPAGKNECVIQKYEKRALIMTTATCGVRCRFCFRRNYPFQNTPGIDVMVGSWLDTHSDVWEVILSGGDPLTLSPTAFQNLIETISDHSSVTTLRIHSRLPVMRPDLVEKHFEFLRDMPARFDCVLVSHVDHPDELDEESMNIFGQLKYSGWTLLNQSVLLKDVNDDAGTMVQLCRKLFEQGVLPYYIHQLDHAKGVAHYEISDDQAKALVAEIRTKLPGYLVPRLVREIAGEKSKTPV